LTVSNSTLADNFVSDGFGSALHAPGAPSVLITGCTVADNRTNAGSGTLFIGSKTATIDHSLITGNRTGGGGTIVNGLMTTLTVSSCTIADNNPSGVRVAGGIANSGTLTVSNSTLARNNATGPQAAGAIATYATSASDATVLLVSSTLSGNTIANN